MGFPKGEGANGDTQAHVRHPHKGMKILKYTIVHKFNLQLLIM